MRELVKFIAFDNKEFATKKECLAYEKDNLAALFVAYLHEGLPAEFDDSDVVERVSGAMSRQTSPDLASAFEKVAKVIADNRIANGGSMRKKKGAPAPVDAPPTPPAPVFGRPSVEA